MFDHPMKPLSPEFIMELLLKEIEEIERWRLLEEKVVEERERKNGRYRKNREKLARVNIEARTGRDKSLQKEKIKELLQEEVRKERDKLIRKEMKERNLFLREVRNGRNRLLREERIKELLREELKEEEEEEEEVEVEAETETEIGEIKEEEEVIKGDIEQRVIKQRTAKQRVVRQRIYNLFDIEFQTDCCVYCGEIATSIDHFIPKAFRLAIEDLGLVNNRLLVPACRECNSTAGSQIFHSLKEKREYIHFCYRRKYRSLLESEDWTEGELNELGHTLRSSVKASQQAKMIIRRRLKWPKR